MRGRDEWVRVSWDEALDLVHNQLKRVRDEHGPTGIFAGSYGWFSCGSLHASRTLLQRYMNATVVLWGIKGTTLRVLRKSSCRMCLVLLRSMNNKPAGNLC